MSRNDEALELLLFSEKDLNAGEGQVKKTLMDILSALGTNDNLASKYRRMVYSLLYYSFYLLKQAKDRYMK